MAKDRSIYIPIATIEANTAARSVDGLAYMANAETQVDKLEVLP